MCGRFNVSDSSKINDIIKTLDLVSYPIQTPRFNVTPGSMLYVYHQNGLTEMEWGIEFGEFKHPNTRMDTLKKKPFLKQLLLNNRCVVPVNGFYEWPNKKYRPEFKNIKTRYSIHTPEKTMFCGGFYQLSVNSNLQFNILTTQANQEIDRFHHRMPVILSPEKVKAWLQTRSLNEMYQMAKPSTDPLVIYECHEFVDSGKHEGPKCMELKGLETEVMKNNSNIQLSLF